MTDAMPPANPDPGAGSAPTLRALSQFVKDLSFENPANQLPEGQPNIDIGIDVSAAPHDGGQGVYETSLKLKARAHIGEATLFLMELDYCGLFQILGLSEQDAEAALLIECPRMLFPFARRLVADITREGGFPPLLIDPVDFVNLYRQQKQRQDRDAAMAAAAAAPGMPLPAQSPANPAPAPAATPVVTPSAPPPQAPPQAAPPPVTAPVSPPVTPPPDQAPAADPAAAAHPPSSPVQAPQQPAAAPGVAPGGSETPPGPAQSPAPRQDS